MQPLIIAATDSQDLKRGVDYIGVCCVFVCHDGNGRIVMHKRSARCRDEHGRWDCGGGSMEFGESFEDAVRREVREEYGTDIVQLNYAGVRSVVRDNNGTPTHWVAVVFAAQVRPELVRIGEPEKMDDLGWFTPDQLPTPLHSKFLDHFPLTRPFI
ncbi:MAG: NUDIX domain-containing protein [bacterium]|nr:NUDIX domain-containing protein [bacterium]